MKRMLVFLMVFIFAASAFATFAKYINWQGKATDPSGVALDGVYSMTFRILKSSNPATDMPGDTVWTEIRTVNINQGLFDVLLGQVTPLNIPFNDTYWVELQIASEVLLPRIIFSAVPYAFRAINADTAYIVAAGAIQVDGISITGNGTTSNPLAAVLGNSIESTEITDATITSADLNDGLIFTTVQNNAGVDQFNITDGSRSLRFNGTGGATISFDAGTHTVTISAAGAGDNWGTQVVQHDASLTGTGVTGSLLGVANGGINDYHVNWGLETNQVNAADIPYDNTGDTYITSTNVDGALGDLDAAISAISGGTSSAYIQNQYASAQTANFWINGNSRIDGNLTVGNIIGQGSAWGSVGTPVTITDPLTPVTLASVTYTATGPGSTIHLDFSGTFDDRAGRNGAYVLVELVRNPGAGETIIATSQISIYSNLVHQLQSVSIAGVDVPPPGTHTYAIRARVVKEPYTSGRCLNGVLKLAEIKD